MIHSMGQIGNVRAAHPTQPAQQATPAVLHSDLYNDPAMRPFLEEFLADLPDRLSAMNTAWQRGDLVRLAHLATLLKGVAGGFGFPAMAQAAHELGQSAIGGAPADRIKSELHQLASLYEAAVRGIEWGCD